MTLPYDLPWWGWAIAVIGALLIGFSKTGVTGMGAVSVAVFTLIFPARASTGIVLPMLIVGDVIAVVTYRRHAIWSHLLRLLPWTGLGLILGYFALDFLDTEQVGRLIGVLLLIVTALQFWRMRSSQKMEQAGEAIAHNIWLTILVGVLAGFVTMVSNAAGPIMIIYFLAMGLMKNEFMGTSAWFYFVLNLTKAPLSYSLGLITPQTLLFGAMLAPVIIVGTLAGYQILKRMNQKLFEQVALALTVIAALRLVVG